MFRSGLSRTAVFSCMGAGKALRDQVGLDGRGKLPEKKESWTVGVHSRAGEDLLSMSYVCKMAIGLFEFSFIQAIQSFLY